MKIFLGRVIHVVDIAITLKDNILVMFIVVLICTYNMGETYLCQQIFCLIFLRDIEKKGLKESLFDFYHQCVQYLLLLLNRRQKLQEGKSSRLN